MSLNFFKENKIIIAVFMTVVICTIDLLAPSWYDVWVLSLLPLFFMSQSEHLCQTEKAMISHRLVCRCNQLFSSAFLCF